MRFLISSTFAKSLQSLSNDEQSQARQAAFDFQLNPRNPGFKFHRVDRAKDKRFWTFRITRDLRAVVHLTDDTFTLCYADHHDAAYRWAERRRLEIHPTTGAVQIIETHEHIEEVVRKIVQEVVTDPPAFARYEVGYLLSLGVPVDWVDCIRSITADQFVELSAQLPEEAAERLMRLMVGEAVAPPVRAADPFYNPDTNRRFLPVSDAQSLKAALDAPWDRWIIFLHPTQRRIVETDFAGPSKVFGGAGTGKTVVGLHRAAWLARKKPSARILLTTYTKTLTARIGHQLDLLMGAGDPARKRIEVNHVHSVATRLYKRGGRRLKLVDGTELRQLIDRARRDHGVESCSTDYLTAEWSAIIDPMRIRSWQEYRSTPRQGRGRALGGRQKKRIWSAFESVQQHIATAGQQTWDGLFYTVIEQLNADSSLRYDHVIIDEAQDFGLCGLRLLRALANPGPGDLMLCADAGQRIYKGRFSLIGAGIDVRGRSKRLRVNYRTTEQIRSFSDHIVPTKITTDDGEEDRRSSSLHSGPAPERIGCDTKAEEIVALTGWLKARLDEGMAPGEIAIFARSRLMLTRRARPALEAAGLSWEMLSKDPPLTPTTVTLATMHQCKGLEFKAVAVVGCDADALPSKRALASAADGGDKDAIRAQERSLLYVACTRARDRLLVTWTGTPSPFLHEERESPVAVVEAPKPRRITAFRPQAPYRLSPSRAARYFLHNCERSLRFGCAATEVRRSADGVPASVPEASPLLEAIFRHGYEWEKLVVEGPLHGRVHVPEGEAPVEERQFTYGETVDLLRVARPGDFIYQAVFIAPKRFYERYSIDSDLVTISTSRPDLIEVLADGDGRLFRIIDMKSGDSLRSIYRIQVLFYALQLVDILLKEGITDARVDLELGGVWLGHQPEYTPCTLSGVRPHLERLLSDDIGRILTSPPEKVRWHLTGRCEWCPFFSHCREEMVQTDDLSRISGLTAYGKRHLQSEGVHTTAQLQALLAMPEKADDTLSGCASLTGRRPDLTARVTALRTGTIQLHGRSSLALPRAEDHEVIVAVMLQQEPLGKSLYLAGLRTDVGAQVPRRLPHARGPHDTLIFLAQTPEQVPAVRRQLIGALYVLLQRVDAYNLGRDIQEQLSLQVYLHTNQERRALLDLLLESLSEPELSEAAITLLFHFQGEQLIRAKDHPEDQVVYPAVPLLSSLASLLALPIDVSYTLPEVLDALDYEGSYPREDDLHFPLGHGLRAELIYEAWHHDQTDNLARLRLQADSHLSAILTVLHALREQADSQLFTWAPRFALPPLSPVRDVFLSRLIFLTRYEAFLGCQETREARRIARDAVSYADGVFALQAEGGGWMRLVSGPAARLNADDFPSRLLVTDDTVGRKAQLRYPDHVHRKSWSGGQEHSANRMVVKVPEVKTDALGRTTAIKVTATRSRLQPIPGQHYLLYPRHTDFTTDNVIDFLASLEGSRSLLIDLLRNPTTSVAGVLDAAVVPHLAAAVAPLGLTESQTAAWDAVCTQRITAVWGPPGTGKTHFLASLIIGLAWAHAQAGRPFSVVISAFTNAAIENLLAKIISRQAELPGLTLKLSIGKAKGWSGEKLGVVVDPKNAAHWLQRKGCGVVGGTIYQLIKDPALTDVDLVVVDEASQLEVPRGAIPAHLIGTKGRVVFAGDHYQLPPIIKGEYPEPDPGEPVLHRSVFEALIDIQGGALCRQLLENFRMNATLTSASADLLYGPRYVPGNAQVRDQVLPFTAPDGLSGLAAAALDPAYPLVLVVLNGVTAARENAIEAGLVAEMVCGLRGGLRDDAGAIYGDDAAFFKHGVFVVCPHHAQIQQIQQKLAERRLWTVRPFVDTVDKMQGQEAQAVIVGYGVSDPEFAQQEARFIYSRNRLNVSITRGRAKTVVCLPRPLLDATPAVLEDDEAAEGLAYMRRLLRMMEEQGEVDRFLLGDGGVSVDVYRVMRGAGSST
ncbi:MAG: DNA replication ATP-dependent helicase Dna2 [Myxococcota bacterium]|jgi:DNA replication ATP-dependent helicase Dna2